MRILGIFLAIFILIDIVLASMLFNKSVFSNFIGVLTPKISAISHLPNQKVKIINIDFLERKLDEVSFWTKDNITFYDTKGKKYKTSVKKLEIVITNNQQNFTEYTALNNLGKNIIYQSYGFDFDSKISKLSINLYLSPSTRAKLSNEELSGQYSDFLLHAIYNITHIDYSANLNKIGGRLYGIDDFINSASDEKIIQVFD